MAKLRMERESKKCQRVSATIIDIGTDFAPRINQIGQTHIFIKEDDYYYRQVDGEYAGKSFEGRGLVNITILSEEESEDD